VPWNCFAFLLNSVSLYVWALHAFATPNVAISEIHGSIVRRLQLGNLDLILLKKLITNSREKNYS
jgi:hypothetical protein